MVGALRAELFILTFNGGAKIHSLVPCSCPNTNTTNTHVFMLRGNGDTKILFLHDHPLLHSQGLWGRIEIGWCVIYMKVGASHKWTWGYK